MLFVYINILHAIYILKKKYLGPQILAAQLSRAAYTPLGPALQRRNEKNGGALRNQLQQSIFYLYVTYSKIILSCVAIFFYFFL